MLDHEASGADRPLWYAAAPAPASHAMTAVGIRVKPISRNCGTANCTNATCPPDFVLLFVKIRASMASRWRDLATSGPPPDSPFDPHSPKSSIASVSFVSASFTLASHFAFARRRSAFA